MCPLLLVGLEKFGETKQKKHLILFEMFVVFLYICTEKERKKVNKRKVVTKFLQHKRARRDDKRV